MFRSDPEDSIKRSIGTAGNLWELSNTTEDEWYQEWQSEVNSEVSDTVKKRNALRPKLELEKSG